MRQALDGWKGGLTDGGNKISNIRYADDSTLIVANKEEMVILIQQGPK